MCDHVCSRAIACLCENAHVAAFHGACFTLVFVSLLARFGLLCVACHDSCLRAWVDAGEVVCAGAKEPFDIFVWSLQARLCAHVCSHVLPVVKSLARVCV